MIAASLLPADGDLLSALDRNGWAVIRGAAPASTVCDVARDLAPVLERTPCSEGLFYGSHTRRFGRLLSRSAAMAALVTEPCVLSAARTIIGRDHDTIGLNLTQLIAVSPGAPAQVPHRDDEMWPLRSPRGEHLVNVLWPLTAFSAENGATRVWTGSQRGSRVREDARPVIAAMDPGDALVVLGSTLHAQGANVSREVRTCVVVGYHAAWLLPGENPWLSYPPEEVRSWPSELSELVGYRRLPPNLNGVDCRCPSGLLGTPALGATDALRPEQIAGLRRFHGLQT